MVPGSVKTDHTIESPARMDKEIEIVACIIVGNKDRELKRNNRALVKYNTTVTSGYNNPPFGYIRLTDAFEFCYNKKINMKIFVTGASGFIGSEIVKDLISAGHEVTGLARSEQSAKKISGLGAASLQADLTDLAILQQAAAEADGVIHTAFVHDFMQTGDFASFAAAAATDKAAILAMGAALKNTTKPVVVTAGILGLPLIDGYITEDSHFPSTAFRASETAAMELAGKGIHASVIRLAPSVHDKGDAGFIPFIIGRARQLQLSAYPAGGDIRWTAVHRKDAARAFRLAVEKANKGARYNVIAENGITLKSIATLIGEKLNLPVAAVAGEELQKHFDWMGRFIASDSPATNVKTKQALGWEPSGIGLREDMQQNYL